MQQFSFNQKYYVGAYERLSREDDRKEESSSIESQKMIIESFAKFNKLHIIKHYSDDGFTGSNFNRPGFEELKRDIEDGMINCVIVKDLSRLGRELYLTGQYIEEYFLSKDVRFIAINDGYDSEIGDSMLGIRLSVNDMYLRDTSKKIRSSLDEKRRRGDYIGSYAAYGYMKNPDNPKQLIPDPNVAHIVKQMFDWASIGMGTTTIAHKLTEMNVPIPTIYKKINTPNCNYSLNDGNGIWRPQTVKSILENEMYLGHMIQGRWKKPSYNIKGCVEVKNKANWFVVKDTHEPLVDEAKFEIVQQHLARNTRYRANTVNQRHLLQGLLYCKECGNKIGIQTVRKAKGEVRNIQCYTYSKYGRYGRCSSHYANYDDLENDILHYLHDLGAKFLENYDTKSMLAKSEKILYEDLANLENEKQKCEKQLEQENRVVKQLYIDKMNGTLSTRQYVMLAKDTEESITHLESKISEIIEKTDKLKNRNDHLNLGEIEEIMKKFFKYALPANSLLLEVIDKIVIDKEQNIEIFFKQDVSKFIQMDKKRGEN
ncbi:MAG: recombinase family protein [Erysipelotrichaceae bacterium]|nr:recombinase family protein [Erysipelotrichaceae bacterium]